jgi:hypothetical protein
MVRLRKRPLFALAALVGLVFSGVSEARGLEPCPHHDVLPASLASGQGGPDQPLAGGKIGSAGNESSHAGHDVASSRAASDTDDAATSGHESDHRACTCIGRCDAGSSPAILSAPRITLQAAAPAPVVSSHAANRVFSRGTDRLWLFHQPTAPPLSV